MIQAQVYEHLDDLPDFRALADLAQILPASRASIYRMAEQGQIPRIRVGRRIILSREHIKLWLKKSLEVDRNAQEV